MGWCSGCRCARCRGRRSACRWRTARQGTCSRLVLLDEVYDGGWFAVAFPGRPAGDAGVVGDDSGDGEHVSEGALELVQVRFHGWEFAGDGLSAREVESHVHV